MNKTANNVMLSEIIYIDIMEGTQFVDQLPYVNNPNEEWDAKKIEEYVYSRRPSLRYRNVNFDYSEHKRI